MYGEIDILCKTHNLSGNIVAHTVKQTKDRDEEDFKCPTPYDIAGGAMNYNKAYCIICIHRPYNQSDKTNTSVEIDIQKVKKHRVGGTPTMVPVNYNPWSTWYKSETTPRGFGAIEGAFNEIRGVTSVFKEPEIVGQSFTEKIQSAEPPLDKDGDQLPF